MTGDKRVTVRLPPGINTRLKRKLRVSGMTTTQIVVAALDQYLRVRPIPPAPRPGDKIWVYTEHGVVQEDARDWFPQVDDGGGQ